MFARLSTYGLSPGDALKDCGPLREAVDAIAELDGLEDAYLLLDEQSGAALTVTVWADHEALTASRVRATRLRTDAARDAGADVLSTVELRVVSRARSAVR